MINIGKIELNSPDWNRKLAAIAQIKFILF